MKHVFVSYKHDRDSIVFVQLLIHEISRAGFEAWTDNRISRGEDWRAEIDQAIKNSLALIVIMTPAAKLSEYITYEWAFALGLGIRVIPIRYEETELHPRLEAFQFLNFTNPEFFPWSSLIKDLNEIVLQKKEAWLEAGKVFLERKGYEEALRAYNEVISLDDKDAVAYAGKSRTLSKLKRYQEALAASQRSIELDANMPLAWENKGDALYNLKKYQEGLAACEEAIRLNPELVLAWYTKGCALYGLNRYQEALRASEEALRINPDYALAWNTKGCALYGLNRYQETLAACEQALQLDFGLAPAWHTKGCALEALGRDNEARQCYKNARQLGYKRQG
jgi:tetratricopeptide (TPR) repeat protein